MPTGRVASAGYSRYVGQSIGIARAPSAGIRRISHGFNTLQVMSSPRAVGQPEESLI